MASESSDEELKSSESEIVQNEKDKSFGETTKEEKLNAEVSNRGQLQRTELAIRSGPLPDPETLNRYEEVVPGAADRIIAMAEKQLNHRTDMEERLVKCQVEDVASGRRETARGQTYGLTIGLSTVAAGTLIAVLGSPIVGAGVMGTTLIGLVSVFVVGRKGDNVDNKQLPSTTPSVED